MINEFAQICKIYSDLNTSPLERLKKVSRYLCSLLAWVCRLISNVYTSIFPVLYFLCGTREHEQFRALFDRSLSYVLHLFYTDV